MARQMIDILLNGSNDLKVSAGDFGSGESKVTHNENLILCEKGEWKENPTMCVGAGSYLEDDAVSDLLNAVSDNLRRDGMSVKSVKQLPNKDIETDGFYK